MPFPSQGRTHRATVTGRRAMIASAHPLASVAGLRIAMDGGNAIDSAIATAAALNVVEPYMSGLAGLGYMHIYSAEHGEHLILDYMGRSPRTTTRDAFIELDPGTQRGPRFPLVPGACAGWLAALERFGSLDAATVFAPAIELAEQGFAFTVNNHGFTQSVASVLKADPASAANYLREGAAPRPGDILVQPDLARTLRSIAAEGPDVFYRGMIAARMVERLGELGGLLTLEDLADYEPRWLKPIRCEYRGYRIYGPPPPCHGALSLALLKIMEGFDVATLGHNTPATLHRFVESCKLALADGLTYLGTENPPIEAMLSASYAADRRALIGEDARPSPGTRFSLEKPADAVSPGDPLRWAKTECTTHFDTIDADGNAVAVSQSIGSLFGCGLVIPGTGLAMNNGMWWFDREPESPNAFAPDKVLHAPILPAQVWDDRGLRMLIGTPGSFGILQTTAQMIMNVLDHGMSIQAAIEAPRVSVTQAGRAVDAESRIPESVLSELSRKGHQIRKLDPWSMLVGGGQGIMVDPESGAFMGGADPRRDGYAIGW